MKKLLKSFNYAWQGILYATRERNFRVHLLLAIIVVDFGILLQVSLTEWALLYIMIGLVIAMELVNSAIEEICDKLRDDLGLEYTATKHIRDLAAGGVLVGALTALAVATIIFLPKLINLILPFFG